MLSAGSTLGAEMWKPHCGLSGLSSFDSRQSSALPNIAITAILEPTRPRPAAPGYTERPARVQFMLGRVGLYSDDLNACQRPDSKRPQALKSRVACEAIDAATQLRTQGGCSADKQHLAGDRKIADHDRTLLIIRKDDVRFRNGLPVKRDGLMQQKILYIGIDGT